MTSLIPEIFQNVNFQQSFAEISQSVVNVL